MLGFASGSDLRPQGAPLFFPLFSAVAGSCLGHQDSPLGLPFLHLRILILPSCRVFPFYGGEI